ncbi:hypothetical protein HGM15179_017990 [Zosterops borbonicus]|uniref:Sodium/potassium-transporting ATPase subunit beta-2 n=1 Tax=Zosterops borbonicus TaxID=364589 RepID=A0A8K1FZX9_9PASS|nr:hypothetical protein HGM15179_017990 [Zosterops borbonicus]
MARDKEKRSCGQVVAEWREFLWDPRTRRFLGRTGSSWGLMIRPCAEGLDVTFNVSQSQTWLQYVRALHQFLEPYNDSVQAARNAACPAGRYNEQPDDSVPNYPKRACRFNRSLLGPCAGLGPHGDYGYASGQPCVLVKVNRVINFFPGKNKSINIVCAAKVNYTQPVVAVQFPNATANVDHHVECRLNAAGLRTDDERDKFAGRVAFRLRINRD